MRNSPFSWTDRGRPTSARPGRARWEHGFVRLQGPGPDEPYQAKIESADYPISPWRVGLSIRPPQATRGCGFPTVTRDTGHTAPSQVCKGVPRPLQRAYRVFVCLPFTREFFVYHPDKPWRPTSTRLRASSESLPARC